MFLDEFQVLGVLEINRDILLSKVLIPSEHVFIELCFFHILDDQDVCSLIPKHLQSKLQGRESLKGKDSKSMELGSRLGFH